MRSSIFCAFSCLTALSAAAPGSYGSKKPEVMTQTGLYVGNVNENFTDVHEFLDIPYGLSTAGRNRFMPPKAVPLSSRRHDATKYPPSCPQFVGGKAIWTEEIPWYLAVWGNSNNSAMTAAEFASEDCLKLAVWTPANATAASSLPVAFFITGRSLHCIPMNCV
jgi:carboxylesterase type B